MSEATTGKNWIAAVITLFGLGILVVVVLGSFQTHLYPTFNNILNNDNGVPIPDEDKAQVQAGWTFLQFMLKIVPVILFFTVVIYMIIVSIRKEREEFY